MMLRMGLDMGPDMGPEISMWSQDGSGEEDRDGAKDGLGIELE